MRKAKIYILNSPIITSYGVYNYQKLTVEQVTSLLQDDFISAIGHEGTAKLLSRIVGVEIPVNRVQISMEVGDLAIVFRVLQRLPEGKVLTAEELSKVPYELGILEKVS